MSLLNVPNRALRARRFVRVLLVLLLAGAMRPMLAASPAAGTLSEASPQLTFTSGPHSVSNPSAQVDGVVCDPPLQPCDTFALTVDLPGDYAITHPDSMIRLEGSWPNPGEDFDFYFLDANGNAMGTSGATSANPEVTQIPAGAGLQTFTVRVVPFAVAGGTATVKLSLVVPVPAGDDDGDNIPNADDDCPNTPTGTGVTSVGCPPDPDTPRFAIHKSPPGVGTDVGEPSIGSNWLSEIVRTNTNVDGSTNSLPNGGTTTFFGGFQNFMLRTRFDDCSSPAAPNWEEMPLLGAAQNSRPLGDPILFTDRDTGRTWVVQLAPGVGATIDITDDDGDNFIPTDGVVHQANDFDHETLAAGPYHAPLAPTPLYDNAVYYAAQGVSQARVWRSDNGGLSFGPGAVTYTVADCAGLHGHLKVAPDGTVYVPPRGCGGSLPFHEGGYHALAVSEDNGLTWTLRPIPGSTSNGNGMHGDPSIGVATSGRVYYGMVLANGHPAVATSDDRGLTWSPVVDIGRSVINGRPVVTATWPAMVAGDKDRAAVAFFGSETKSPGDPYGTDPAFPGVWYLYVSTTFDGGATWTTQNITPGDPIQRGGICSDGTCRNLLDFFDATIDKEGRVLIAGEDGCITDACINGGANDFSAKAFIPRQEGGKRMFAAFDPPQPTRPGAPALTGGLNADSTAANLTWPAPDHGGAPITAYKVYHRVGTSGPFTLMATVPTNSYTDTTFDKNVENYYHVTAVNSAGEGPYCLNFRPAVVALPNPCELPGVRVLEDFAPDGSDEDAGQNTPPDGRVNAQEVYFAEPDLGGANKLVITLQVEPSTAGIAPASSEWFIIWNRLSPDANFDRWYVAMRTNAQGVPSFEYGRFGVPLDPTAPNPNANTPVKIGDADNGSYDVAAGVIRITLSTDKAENVAAGQSLAGINVRTYLGRSGAPGQRSQNNASDITGEGNYTLVGNAACVLNRAPTALLIAFPDTGAAPLTVNFDASGSSDPDAGDGIARYNFDFGDESGAQQDTPTVSHVYNEPGFYTARVSVVDTLGRVSGASPAAEVVITVTGPGVTPGATNTRLAGALPLLTLLALALLAVRRRRTLAGRATHP